MKRAVSMALIALMLALVLAGCGADPAGTYVTTSINGQTAGDYMQNVGATLEMFGIDSAQDLMKMEIRADGTFSVAVSASPARTGTWTRSGNQLSMTLDDVTEEFTLNGEELFYKTETFELLLTEQKA